MCAAKRKKESDQPELPIEGAKPAPAKKPADTNGNGEQHVVAVAQGRDAAESIHRALTA